jgi:DNA repair protein RadC
MSNVADLSNVDLLAMLVGRKEAKKLAAKPLAELFGFKRPRQAVCEEAAYTVHPSLAAAKELILRCMKERMDVEEDLFLTSPEAAKVFLCSKIGHLEYESFWCLWLDAQHRLLEAEEMFRGTVNESKVYPREVVKRALAINAAAVIFAHNHPSGTVRPSREDENLTVTLKGLLGLIGVKVLDHFIVGHNTATSLAEKGLL